MDSTMRFHQHMALAGLLFVTAHPVLFSLPYAAQRPWDPTRASTLTLTPQASVSGMLAWILFGLLVTFAYYRRDLPWRYESWRISHGLLAIAIGALGVHHALDTGRYAQHDGTTLFWLAAFALALAPLALGHVARPLLAARRGYRVVRVAREAERIWRVVLAPAGRSRFRFKAGQFAWLKLERSVGNIREHPLSIASAPAGLPRVEFLVKESGDFTGAISRVAPGTRAFLDGPYGNFTLAGRRGEGIVLIAGGVGIAPVLSIAQDLAARGDARSLRLIYADRTLAQLAVRAELEALGCAPGVEVHVILAEPPPDWKGLRGVPDAANLDACLPKENVQRWLYFVCGPPAMIDAVEKILARRGVPLAQIVSERFRYDTGIVTPRERHTRAVIAVVVAVLVVAAGTFAGR
jgi:predicted ferric reductase